VGWWGWLLLTGVSLSGSVSVKFVGLFVVLYVGCHTIAQLWHIYGNLNNPMVCTASPFRLNCSNVKFCLIVAAA
jgi:dolichyl-phosphate-mannose-protein mannosyltransferase